MSSYFLSMPYIYISGFIVRCNFELNKPIKTLITVLTDIEEKFLLIWAQSKVNTVTS